MFHQPHGRGLAAGDGGMLQEPAGMQGPVGCGTQWDALPPCWPVPTADVFYQVFHQSFPSQQWDQGWQEGWQHFQAPLWAQSVLVSPWLVTLVALTTGALAESPGAATPQICSCSSLGKAPSGN